MSSSSPRRSTRRRKAVQYTPVSLDADIGSPSDVDAAAADTIAVEEDAHESDASEYNDAEHGPGDVEEEDEFDEEMLSEDDDAASVRSTSPHTAALRKGIKRKRIASHQGFEGTRATDRTSLHSRGLGKENALYSRSFQIKTSFGPYSDLVPVCLARDLWSGPMNSTFPSKKTLNKLLKGPSSDDPMSVYEEKLAEEATKGWDWYYGELGQKFRAKQKMATISEAEGRSFLPDEKSSPLGVLVGPVDSQQFHKLQVGESMDFGTAFPKRTREGWILNVGNKVQCISWCPNTSGRFQYLAVAAPVLDHQKCEADASQRNANPFTPSPPHPAAVQIWRFAVVPGDGNGLKRIDMTIKPRLVKVICTKAGDVRRLAWCPSPRTRRSTNDSPAKTINIGLLGGAWGDGTIKVFDIQLKSDVGKTNETDYALAESPAFEAKFSNTQCTCFAWLSPSDIVVGHSDGSIAVWSLVTEAKFHRPVIYTPLHTTYIVNIETAYPTRPDFIVTTAMDGQVRLVSLLDVKSDVVDSSRSRIISPCLAYSPLLMSFMTADEVEILRLFPIRRFTAPLSVARAYSALSAIAPGSMHHPISLFANVGGAAIATNPLSRTMHSKGKHWQQLWFSHAWAAKPTENSADHPGTVKFVDGFRAEVPSLLRHATGDDKTGPGMTSVTIFEEKTAVTALAWNPNRQCAGWAAAGMGSGLLRVEDLSI